MKHMTKTLLALFLGALLALSCGLFVACQPAEPDTPDTPDTPDSPDTPDTPDTPGGDDDEEEESTAGYAGIYPYVVDDPTGEITYSLEILANNDYEMSVTKEFGTFTAIKYYAGPLERVNGAHMSTKPVFISDFTYEGEGAPTDAMDVLAKLDELFNATKGETEDEQIHYFTLYKDTMTFIPDEDQITTLDPTEGYWLMSDFEE